jgi:glutamyl-tRNA reductase
VLICFTSSHRTASFELLEQLERHASAVTDALTAHNELIAGAVVLATCNRFEAYLDIDEHLISARAASADAVIQTIGEAAGVDRVQLRDGSSVLYDHAAAEHLFAVSSGLESVIVGEGEIAGQVRRALHAARAKGTVTRDLERMFQDASRISRGVKNNTGISSAGRSIVRLALELASSRITDWAQTSVLLVGTGAYAGASLAALRDRGATNVRVYSRTGRAATFAASHAIQAVPTDGLTDAVASADLIVTCSVAPTVILDRNTVESAASRPGSLERRLIIDLGLPRNVEAAVTQVDGVELLDLETISLHAPLEELSAAADARALVGEAAAAFAAGRAEQQVEPALIALRSHVFDVLDAEIGRLDKRAADATERDAIESALRHMVGVLLHTPSVRARELAREGEADAFIAGAQAIFGVEPKNESAIRPVELGHRQLDEAPDPAADEAAS